MTRTAIMATIIMRIPVKWNIMNCISFNLICSYNSSRSCTRPWQDVRSLRGESFLLVKQHQSEYSCSTYECVVPRTEGPLFWHETTFEMIVSRDKIECPRKDSALARVLCCLSVIDSTYLQQCAFVQRIIRIKITFFFKRYPRAYLIQITF